MKRSKFAACTNVGKGGVLDGWVLGRVANEDLWDDDNSKYHPFSTGLNVGSRHIGTGFNYAILEVWPKECK